MGASPPIGNKNAEKYSKKDALKLFSDSLKKSMEMVDGGVEYKYDFIGEVARDLKTYHYIYAHLVNRFPELDSMFIELRANLEANCYCNTKKGKIREATGIVNLKSNHKWTDRNDHTSSDKSMSPKQEPLDLSKLSDDELEIMEKLQKKIEG